MKRVFLLLLLSFACYQSHAQMGGYFSEGRVGPHVIPCREYEYIYMSIIMTLILSNLKKPYCIPLFILKSKRTI